MHLRRDTREFHVAIRIGSRSNEAVLDGVLDELCVGLDTGAVKPF
jgi:hypothetical protein